MKVVLSLVVLAVCVALAVGEGCRSVTDCSHENCDTGYTKECKRSFGISGTCTCTKYDACSGSAAGCSGSCRTQWHCIDNLCHCGFSSGK